MAKAEGAASSAEQASAYLGGLEKERVGYENRLANAKAGRTEPLSQDQLADRIAQVDAEIKRTKPAAKAPAE
jgi:uncharacterized small protein (DUF1192 family)